MNFEGAVQVDRERIKQFLDIWEENSDWYDNRIDEITNTATKLLNEWWSEKSWLGKWWYSEYKEVCHIGVLKWWLKYEKGVRRTGTFSSFFNNRHLTCHLLELNELPPKNRWWDLTLRRSDHDNIEDLYKCGEPVYLNPSQAGLVNEFLEMKSLKEVLVGWEKSK